MGDWLIDE